MAPIQKQTKTQIQFTIKRKLLKKPVCSQVLKLPQFVPLLYTSPRSHGSKPQFLFSKMVSLFQLASFVFFKKDVLMNVDGLMSFKQFILYYTTKSYSSVGILAYGLYYFIHYGSKKNYPKLNDPLFPVSVLRSLILQSHLHSFQNTVNINTPLQLSTINNEPSTRHVFLGCLILSHKYNREPAPSNKAWAKITSNEVGLDAIRLSEIERNVIGIMDYSLFVSHSSYNVFMKLIYDWNGL